MQYKSLLQAVKTNHHIPHQLVYPKYLLKDIIDNPSVDEIICKSTYTAIKFNDRMLIVEKDLSVGGLISLCAK
tara:strand:+ start:303 stop:521 length:219 start_codon:yes stop_codon:yes gene_type:complete